MLFSPRSWDRLWARLIDGVVGLVLAWPALGWRSLTGLWGEQVRMGWGLALYLLLVPVLYEGICFWFFGRTLGKWVFLLKVVPAREADRPLAAGEAFARALADQLSLIFGWSVFVVALFRYDRRHVADLLAGTRVLAERPRSVPARIRWVWAGVFMLVFGTASWRNARSFARGFGWDRSGVSFTAADE